MSSTKLITVHLSGGPYASDLFCPYCGEQILDAAADDAGDCHHLVHADIEQPDNAVVQDNDLCFLFYEPAPANRHHYFVFREVDLEEEADA